MLKCPKCEKRLVKKDRTYVCEEHHSYDIAKQGYVNLVLSGKKNSGDDADMIKSRRNFLHEGYYAPLKEAIVEALKAEGCQTLIDAGCGEGYYTSACGEVCDVYGFDLSKSAVKFASTFDKKNTYAIASIVKLPLMNECADALLSVFAPCDEVEFARVLKPNGLFLKVEPAPNHLYELKQVLYEDVYLNEADAQQYKNFVLEKEEILTYMIDVSTQELIHALFQMTPYYYKSSKSGAEALSKIDRLHTTVSFHLEWYRKQVK